MAVAEAAKLRLQHSTITIQDLEDFVEYSLAKMDAHVTRLPTFDPKSAYPWPLACTQLSREMNGTVYIALCRGHDVGACCAAAVAIICAAPNDWRIGMYAPGAVADDTYMFIDSLRRAIALVTGTCANDPDRLRVDTDARIAHGQICGNTATGNIDIALLKWVVSVARHRCIAFEDRSLVARVEDFFVD